MKRILTYKINKEEAGKTIEKFLKEKGYTHAVLVSLKKTENGIRRNGIWAYTNEKLNENDIIEVKIIEEAFEKNIEAVYYPLDIVYEDEDIIVINKPSNMPIHPSMNNHDNTLANALIYYFNNQNIAFTFRCINRLDRDTTGLTIIAKHALSAAILGLAVSKREIKRTYNAICQGYVPDSGTIDAPISRKNDSTIERCVDYASGEKAITHFKRIAYNPKKNLSLVELKLETGRTHQIRVHMKHEGYPLIGDFLYNPDYEYIKRQALHSKILSFVHPISKKEMYFEAPLPLDMKSLL